MIDHKNTSRITCPHCGMDWGDLYFIKEGWEKYGAHACDECGKLFEWKINDPTFTTAKLKRSADDND